MIEKEIAPKVPQSLPKVKPASVVVDGTVVEVVVNTKLAKNVYKAKVEKYKKKHLDCDDKYSQGYTTIRLSYKYNLCIHIKNVESLYEI